MIATIASIIVAWDAAGFNPNASAPKEYAVKHLSAPGVYTEIASCPAAETKINLTAMLAPGRTYTLVVIGRNSAGMEGLPSDSLTVTTDPVGPAPKRMRIATEVSDDQTSWREIPGSVIFYDIIDPKKFWRSTIREVPLP